MWYVLVLYFLLDNGTPYRVELLNMKSTFEKCNESAAFMNQNNTNSRTTYKCERMM